jgi:hypothetical protein
MRREEMATLSLPLHCPVCGDLMPESGYLVKRVPQRNGRLRRIHSKCVAVVDAQTALTESDGRLLGRAPATPGGRR